MPPIRHILFITLSNIGDAILTTPALEALHQAYPNASIDIVADPRSDILFRHCPYRGALFLKHKKAGWRGLLRLVKELRKKRYDLAVDLRTDGLLWLLRARRRIFKIPNRAALARKLHSAEQSFLPVRTLAGTDTPLPTKIWLGETERAQALQLLGHFAGKRLLAMGPGANWAGKIWPAPHFAGLARRLGDHFDALLLLGSAQDAALAAQVAEQAGLPVIDCCGKTDLLTAAALLAHARVFVGNDSGLGHLASAVGTPTVSVFGPGLPWRYRPWGSQALWLQDPHHDIARVGVAEVASLVVAQLDRKAAAA